MARTVSFDSVLRGAANLAGVKRKQILDDQASLLFEFILSRTLEGWEYDWWPELMLVEKRYFREGLWAAGTFSSGAIVFFEPEEIYYENSSASDTTDTPGTGSDWIVAEDFSQYVPTNQAGQTPLGHIKNVYPDDPDINPNNGPLRKKEIAEGILLTNNPPSIVYIQFKEQYPDLSGLQDYDEQTVYTAGDAIFFEKEAYQVLATTAAAETPTTDPAKCKILNFPYFLSNSVKRAAYADWLGSGGGTDAEGKGAAYHEKRAANMIENESYKLRGMRGEYSNYGIRND